MTFSISGKTVLITGANRGIGAALVEAVLVAGARKVYAGARHVADLATLQARYGDRIVALELDVTRADHIDRAASAAGDVDVLVNNAGVVGHMGGGFADPQWIEGGRQEMEVNYFGTFRLTQAFAPILAANGGGAIVNIGSVASLVNFPLFVAYSASKAATHSITQAARILLKSQGTRVFGVYPGPIDTRMAADVPFEKIPASVAAQAIVRGMEAGVEEIFPDPMSEGMGTLYQTSPKGLELQVIEMVGA